jgi:glycosyltransferase involved in cell wall biosynthesis
MDRYSVALVSDWYAPRVGGVERQMHGLARALRERGHEAIVITIHRGQADVDDVPVRRLNLPLAFNDEVAWPGAPLFRTLYRSLQQERVDVVHAHGMFSSMAQAAIVCADALGIPCVITHHSLISPHHRPFARLVYAAMRQRADVVSAVGVKAAADASRVSGRNDVAVLPNGVELNGHLPRVSATGPDGEIRVLSVMRLRPTKSPEGLVKSVPEVLARVPDPSRVFFTIVGDGPLRKKLERLAASLGVAGHVEFAGYRKPEEVRRLLCGAQIFVSSGRKEAQGISLLEARAAGLPIVARAGGGVGEVMESGRHGFIASDRRTFVDAIVRLVCDEDLRRVIGSQTRDGLERFGWDAVVARHLDVYRRAIAVRHRRNGGSSR